MSTSIPFRRAASLMRSACARMKRMSSNEISLSFAHGERSFDRQGIRRGARLASVRKSGFRPYSPRSAISCSGESPRTSIPGIAAPKPLDTYKIRS